jgi:fimbrial chaperone protein
MTLLSALAFLCQGAIASGSTFTVSRVNVFLTSQAKSEVVTIRNTSDVPLRFQVNVFAWDQNAQGEMALTATRDIVFFPPLFSLKPGEERNLRIGTATSAGTTEKTYRLFIEELPSQEGGSGPPGQVAIRTRLGIPIFLRPVKEAIAGRVDQVGVRDSHLAFALRNIGNVHFVAQAIRITGYGATGDTVLEGKLEGWYVLAGGTRLFDLELPTDKCPLLKTVVVEVQTPQAAFTERVDLPTVSCRP